MKRNYSSDSPAWSLRVVACVTAYLVFSAQRRLWRPISEVVCVHFLKRCRHFCAPSHKAEHPEYQRYPPRLAMLALIQFYFHLT